MSTSTLVLMRLGNYRGMRPIIELSPIFIVGGAKQKWYSLGPLSRKRDISSTIPANWAGEHVGQIGAPPFGVRQQVMGGGKGAYAAFKSVGKGFRILAGAQGLTGQRQE